mgnify:CR=1 FL=1
MGITVEKLVPVNINGKEYQLPEGIYLTEAAKLVGIEIPQFCAYRWLEPLGACRMCLVRIEGMPKLQIACATPVRAGMVVITESEEIRKVREEMLEFHLLNHPLECPVCDRGGECPLQDLTERYGKYKSRYIEEKLVRADTNLNPFLRMNYKRCILCKRCVRYCDEVSGDHLVEFEGRGGWTKVTTFLGPSAPNRFSGNIIELCPVGAITSIPFRFRGRAWELEKTRTICNQCSVGCNIELHSRLGALQRIVPAVNIELDDGHICDRGRFAYGYVHSKNRIQRPMLKKNSVFEEATWNEAEKIVADKLNQTILSFGADAVGIIAGNSLTNEDYFFLRKFVEEIGTKNFSFCEDLIQADHDFSSLPRLILSNLGSLPGIMGSEAIVLLGCDLLEEAPVLGLRVEEAVRKFGAKLISFSSYSHDSERLANARIRYHAGQFRVTLKRLAEALNKDDCAPEFAQVVSLLKEARSVSLIVGQELLWNGRSQENLSAVYAFARELKTFGQSRKTPLERIKVNPIFRGANSLGAIIFNFADSLKGGDSTNDYPSVRQILEKCASQKIKLLYLVGANPLVFFPDRALAKEALEKVQTIIVQDLFLTESSHLSHVFLPVSPFIFRDGSYLNFEGRLQRVRSVSFTDETPSDAEVLNRILIVMGKKGRYSTIEELFTELSSLLPLEEPITLDSIPANGVLLRFRDAENLGNFALEDTTAEEPNSVNYPFSLIPKHYLFRNSVKLRETPWMAEVANKPFVFMSVDDGAKLSLRDGDEVSIESPHGKLVLPIRLSNFVPPGSVLIDTEISNKPINVLFSIYEEIPRVKVVKLV